MGAALARACVAFSLLLALIPLVLVRLDYTYGNHLSARFVAVLALACALSALIFLAGGVAIAPAPVPSSASEIARKPKW